MMRTDRLSARGSGAVRGIDRGTTRPSVRLVHRSTSWRRSCRRGCARCNAAALTSYIERLESATAMHEELRELAAKLTIGETYFFRSPEQLRVFSEVALPRLTRPIPPGISGYCRAGCSTGEEPYTLAMTLRELGPLAPADVSILAIDINPEAWTKARRGRYSAGRCARRRRNASRNISAANGSQFALDEGVQAMVRFEERSMALEDDQFWQPIVRRRLLPQRNHVPVGPGGRRSDRAICPRARAGRISFSEPRRAAARNLAGISCRVCGGRLLLRAAQRRRSGHAEPVRGPKVFAKTRSGR